jgi:hypothetical protein
MTQTYTREHLESHMLAYKQNEADNLHSENTVLLAAHFGTNEDFVIAEGYLAMHKRLGQLPQNQALRDLHYEIQKRCWDLFVSACAEAGLSYQPQSA